MAVIRSTKGGNVIYSQGLRASGASDFKVQRMGMLESKSATKGRHRRQMDRSPFTWFTSGMVALIVLSGVLVGAFSITRATTAHAVSPVGNMQVAIQVARTYDPALAAVPTVKVEAMVERLTHSVTEGRSAPASSSGVHLDSLLVTRTGNTLWFPKTQVALWATAATGAALAALVYFGVAVFTAGEYIGALIATFWGAVAMDRCVWFTFKSPISIGKYAC